ncbi:MAG: hypothetical protein QM500_12145 [Methylococcales bacterium]
MENTIKPEDYLGGNLSGGENARTMCEFGNREGGGINEYYMAETMDKALDMLEVFLKWHESVSDNESVGSVHLPELKAFLAKAQD